MDSSAMESILGFLLLPYVNEQIISFQLSSSVHLDYKVKFTDHYKMSHLEN